SIRPKKSLHGGKSVSFKTEPLNQAEAKKIDEVKVGISISNLFDSNKLIPAYLASINDGIKEYDLLINQEADKILQAKEGQLIQAGINYSALSPKTRAVIDFLKSKGQVNLEALFNGLGYSFQDLDYIIKDLCAKDLIKNVNGKIFIKNDYSLFNFKGNIKSHEISAKIVENDYDNSANAKKFLIKIGLNPVKIRKIYIR
ncbi:MAG: hypothetical protein PHT91_02505, partial [Candidatus Nanoarchaeia archaeon]|nr:hypothetical protein [Candidatus Nanoarchaeia archaeon]